jgi:hypothetical protein
MACKAIYENLYAYHGPQARSIKNATYLCYKEQYDGTDFLMRAQFANENFSGFKRIYLWMKIQIESQI